MYEPYDIPITCGVIYGVIGHLNSVVRVQVTSCMTRLSTGMDAGMSPETNMSNAPTGSMRTSK